MISASFLVLYIAVSVTSFLTSQIMDQLVLPHPDSDRTTATSDTCY
ncbi:MAG: hypothetical protein P4M11_13910 [Candidatus Pacebacteria bacterium]|nr:hypothetical protein [Candidatus Paceibacterota bacterium]